MADAAEVEEIRKNRLSDAQALGALAAYLVFRAITNRVGLAYLPRLLDLPWIVPLLNNSSIVLIAVGTKVRGDRGDQLAVGAASVFLATVAALILYWAGWRFGPLLAEKAAREGSMWASVWNPKQVARAHRWVERYGFFAVALGRVIEFFTVPVILVAGASRMTFAKFLAAHTVGAVGFVALNLWLGGRAGEAWPWLPERIRDLGAWSFRITLVLLALLVLASLLSRKQREAPERVETTPSDGL